MEEKKGFPFPVDTGRKLNVHKTFVQFTFCVYQVARKSISTSRNKVIFEKLDVPVSTNRTKISK